VEELRIEAIKELMEQDKDIKSYNMILQTHGTFKLNKLYKRARQKYKYITNNINKIKRVSAY